MSLNLHGDEEFHLVLRLKSSIELFQNHDKYLTIFRSVSAEHKTSFPEEIEFLSMMFHFSETQGITDDKMFKAFTCEAMRNKKRGCYLCCCWM